MRTLFIVLLFLIFSSPVLNAQEQNITSYLKMVEAGNIKEASDALINLKNNLPNDPSVKFLDAVLTEDGNKANQLYLEIFEQYPKSNYADASLYRIFSFYYSDGIYKKAEEYKNLLLKNYPSSPYVKAANRKLPDEEISGNESVVQELTESPVKEISGIKDFNYTIQAGAFLNINNAQNLKSRFESDGYYSNIFPKDIGGSILNVVSVGRFSEITEAENFLSKLNTVYKIEGRIIPNNN
ncbi:MAG: SPOR domain-containing protein [Bacteroidetes bacterium]|nr:SPOR domain-containing protein [Bacteroidota bacterium]